MTPDERKMLTDLADRIAQTPPPPKDPEAEELIRTKIGSRPDALYLMTQTVLIQNMALQQAQQQLQQLQRSSGGQSSGSFLGGTGPGGSGYSQGGAQQYAPPPPQQQYAAPGPGTPSGAPSFLRGAAQTAAGVAAGALAFEGIQHLFSGPGYGGGGGFFGGGGGIGGYAPAVDETIVNNYYDTPGGGDDYRRDALGPVNDAQYDDGGSDYENVSDDGGFDDNSGGGDDFV
jgi:uncharacterized protein